MLNWRGLLARCLPTAWRSRIFTDQRFESTAQALATGIELVSESSALPQLEAALRGAPNDLAVVLQALRALPEQAEADLTRSSRLLLPPPEWTVISLGTHCFTSAMLRRWGLRDWSGPFDWLFSSAAMVAHCIEDDFQLLLDPAQFEPVPLRERAAGPTANRVQHRYYQEVFGVDHVFNHHDVHLPDDYGHFVRAVDRFRQALTSERPKLFVMHRWHHGTALEQLEPLREVLAERCRNYRLMVISVRESIRPAWPQTAIAAEHPDMVAYTFDPVSRWQPLSFPALIDEQFLMHLIRHQSQALAASTTDAEPSFRSV